MGKIVFTVILLALAVPAFAVEEQPVAYFNGTVSQLKPGTEGSLDTTSGTVLVFHRQGGTLEIPYDRIESYEHSKEVAVHLGVAPAIAVGLVKRRKRNHFLRITFKDGSNLHQVVVFEIPKTLPIVLMPALMARSPQARCAPFSECAPMIPSASMRLKVQENSASGSGSIASSNVSK